MKWICQECWRHGNCSDLETARVNHLQLIQSEQMRTPNPAKLPPGSKILKTYGSLSCSGDQIRLEGDPQKKRRFKRQTEQLFEKKEKIR